ncbi:polysaccharide deacetylase family protein [Phyllobacterium sp. 0TCS1.6C]|uniref:polysaccharide deacetylase family protein n=1 Tax=unclassified Phyllobacterium TaxID=2638441 RepID=UPI002264C469|nr:MULTISPECIES: polysaccharide deacetylase family protein [unclassified Phyllobacterium]MCX8281360.1 polysaccharide deacetylase family protein [Phyllobacterium sp. 0TCS1.6C]MCX8295984.1 polysaccharide deacetylase family protein [Phyllobacterium sp. 0TCS1.6A]
MRAHAAALAAIFTFAAAGTAIGGGRPHFVEPQLYVHQGGPDAPQLALTLDACSGQTDQRILDMLVANRIQATIFVTGRWLKRNPVAVATLLAHPDLFELENHGLAHVPAIDDQPTMFGLKTAGSLAAIQGEIDGGANAMQRAALPRPHWYRDATARYSTDAVALIHGLGYRLAGYSLNADMGASLLAGQVERRLEKARDGDVIIAHINQPTRAAGEGVVKGILALKARGFRFVRLEDVTTAERPVRPGA